MILGNAATTLVAKRAAALIILCVFIFMQGRSFSGRAQAGLYGLFGAMPFVFLVV